MKQYTVAIVQLDTTPTWAENMLRIEGFIDQAAQAGAKLIAFPESFSQYLGARTPAESLQDSPTLARMAAKARLHGMWVLCGSLFTPAGERKHNTSVLFSSKGEVAGIYHKMHMFDVTLPTGETRLESKHFSPGTEIVTVETPLGHLGMSICYDVRFPEQYRAMAARGAELFLIPSMFTKPTGRLHWELLLRARAAENGCYVIAPNQIDGRFGSYGHSMIVDPQGKVLCEIPEGEGIAFAEIDLDFAARVRQNMPSTRPEKGFEL